MIELKKVTKYFENDKEKEYVLKDVSIKIEKGDFITIMGPSGGGKSTLLNIIGLLTEKSNGEIIFNETKVNYKKKRVNEKIRRENIGFVFQNNNLISSLNVLDNIIIAMDSKESLKKKKERVYRLLEEVGLKGKEKFYLSSLSGGQAQRVSILRALVNSPEILLCDEPTGALDSKNSKNVIDMLMNIRREKKITLIIVTHDKNIGLMGERRFYLEDGELNEVH